MYKLCLIQVSELWDWYLQPIIPADMPFSPDRCKHHGVENSVQRAIRQAFKIVDKREVEYTYLDRRPVNGV